MKAASRNLLKEWATTGAVGIWEGCEFSIRLYEDRAIYKGSVVKWDGNTGTLANDHRRIIGETHARLLDLARLEEEDLADYTSQAFELIED